VRAYTIEIILTAYMADRQAIHPPPGIPGHFDNDIKSSIDIQNGFCFSCNWIAFMRFWKIIDVVTGHTHPGTGVVYLAILTIFS
jgi:hypothetical protein